MTKECFCGAEISRITLPIPVEKDLLGTSTGTVRFWVHDRTNDIYCYGGDTSCRAEPFSVDGSHLYEPA